MLPQPAGEASRNVRCCPIDARDATQLEPRRLLLVIGVLLLVNTARLARKRARRQDAFHDGQPSRVTRFDVALSAALAVAALGASACAWWLAR